MTTFHFLSGAALVTSGVLCWLVMPMLANYVCWKLRMERERDLQLFASGFVEITPLSAVPVFGKSTLVTVSFLFSVALWFSHGVVIWPYLCLAALLLLLSLVDMETHLLPDELVSLVLWGGVAAAWLGITQVSLYECIVGIAVGYVMFTVPGVVLKMTTGHDVMGQGDVKLLAACGAWLGAAQVMAAACTAIALMLIVSFAARNRTANRCAFGPALSVSVLIVLFYKQVIL